MAIQQKKLQITIITRADEPLHIDGSDFRALEAAIDKAVRETVDLRYWPESRHIEERHDYLGISLETV